MNKNARLKKLEPESETAWGKLGFLSVVSAIAIIVVVVIFTPKPIDDPELIKELQGQIESGLSAEVPKSFPKASLQLSDIPSEISDQKLQERLMQLADEAVGALPEDPAALHVAAMVFSELQKTKTAEELWLRCLQRKPTQPGPYVGYAELLVKLGRPEEADKLLAEQEAQFADSAVFAEARAHVLDQLGEAEKALSLLEKSVQAHPELAESWIQLGQLQVEVGQYEAAESSLRTAVAMGVTNSTVIFALSNAVARQGKKEEAAQLREVYSKLRAEADPSGNRFQEAYSSALHAIAVRAMVNLSAMYLEHGDLARSEKIVLELLALDPQHVSAHMTLSAVLRKTGRLPDAIVVHERLIRLEPDNPFNVINLASVTLEMGEFGKAEKILKDAAEKSPPNSGLLHAEVARLYFNVGRLEDARTFARQAVAREPNRAFYGVLANICKEMGDSGGVFDALEGIRKLESQSMNGPTQ